MELKQEIIILQWLIVRLPEGGRTHRVQQRTGTGPIVGERSKEDTMARSWSCIKLHEILRDRRPVGDGPTLNKSERRMEKSQ